ncbi:MAG: hypothetical protein R3175_14090 [Marinobacter sp.]|uniref:hypothetical protein n=1 Tax=Marinobacter sp. TaxID=50741 RepID=UPI00299D6919|nr:hypothetical protein [Marinobacter sp.]MDX1757182.1 hypothetical protein [Marinobacter sp.]
MNHPQTVYSPVTDRAHPVQLVRTWIWRSNRRRALRREFSHASPEWLAWIEQDIGLQPGDLLREMHKPFWSH